MKPFRLAALSLALLTTITLVGCDDSDDKTSSAAPATATASTSTPAPASAPAKPDNATLEKLAALSMGKTLTLLDASEIQLDGAAALVLTFSVPLDPSQDFARTVHVVDKKSGKVDGAWELAPNLQELRLRHLEPNRNLVVTVERDLL
ncbi:MAG: hypothetical protein E7A38_05880, partial [Leclercia adecarboxylata]|nr:hypothetical protein [Leclercia adecarboxylata]